MTTGHGSHCTKEAVHESAIDQISKKEGSPGVAELRPSYPHHAFYQDLVSEGTEDDDESEHEDSENEPSDQKESDED